MLTEQQVSLYLEGEVNIPLEFIFRYEKLIFKFLRLHRCIETLQTDIDFEILSFKNVKYKVVNIEGNISLEELPSEEEKLSIFLTTSSFEINICPEVFKDTVKRFNGTILTNDNQTLITVLKQLVPQTWEFINNKFDYNSSMLIDTFTITVFRILIVMFLKNFKE